MKNKQEIYKEISNFLRWDMFDEALALLKANTDLDTMYHNGEFILRAIAAKNVELTRYLIEHCNGLHTKDTSDYQAALHKMQQIIGEAVATCDIPNDI